MPDAPSRCSTRSNGNRSTSQIENDRLRTSSSPTRRTWQTNEGRSAAFGHDQASNEYNETTNFISTETSRTERRMGIVFLSDIFLSDDCRI